MSSKGFDIKLNGHPLCRAGFVSADYRVNCMLTMVKRKDQGPAGAELRVIGSEGEGAVIKRAKWTTTQLAVGDRITIKVTSGAFEPPQSTHRLTFDKHDPTLTDRPIKDVNQLEE
jgi:hypothetical protein